MFCNAMSNAIACFSAVVFSSDKCFQGLGLFSVPARFNVSALSDSSLNEFSCFVLTLVVRHTMLSRHNVQTARSFLSTIKAPLLCPRWLKRARFFHWRSCHHLFVARLCFCGWLLCCASLWNGTWNVGMQGATNQIQRGRSRKAPN